MSDGEADPVTGEAPSYRPPGRAIRLAGRAQSVLMSATPRLWRPLLGRATARFWDRVAGRWDSYVADDERDRAAPLRAGCELLPRAPERVLELGTGTGTGALLLAEMYPEAEVTGVDISPAMVRAAREKLPPELADRVRFETADASALAFPDGAFDLVALLNLPVFFDEVARVLAPGGHVVVASTLGGHTPYRTPPRLLRRGLAARGLEIVGRGEAGTGDYVVARRPA